MADSRQQSKHVLEVCSRPAESARPKIGRSAVDFLDGGAFPVHVTRKSHGEHTHHHKRETGTVTDALTTLYFQPAHHPL